MLDIVTFADPDCPTIAELERDEQLRKQAAVACVNHTAREFVRPLVESGKFYMLGYPTTVCDKLGPHKVCFFHRQRAFVLPLRTIHGARPRGGCLCGERRCTHNRILISDTGVLLRAGIYLTYRMDLMSRNTPEDILVVAKKLANELRWRQNLPLI